MKKVSFNKAWKIALAFILSFSFLGAITQNVDLSAEEKFDIKETIEVNDEKTQAMISLDTKGINEQYTIESIKDPNGQEMDIINNPSFTVGENGTFKFLISYRIKDVEGLQTYEKEVKIKNLESKKEQQIGENNSRIIDAQTIVIDGAVTLDIPEYDGNSWDSKDIKTVSVKVDFGDATSAGKKIKIVLPEGLKYVQIPVAGSYDKTNVNTSILSELPASNLLSTAIKKVSIPKAGIPLSYTNGMLEYEFTAGTEAVTLEVKVQPDDARIYKAQPIAQPIEAAAQIGDNEIGSTQQGINISGHINGIQSLISYSADGASTEVLPSTEFEESFGVTRRNMWAGWSKTSPLKQRYIYIKNAKYEIYYPQGMEFKSISGFDTKKYTIVVDKNECKVTVTAKTDELMLGADYRIRYKVPEGIEKGTYENKEKDTIEFQYYDGTVASQELKKYGAGTDGKYSVEVIDANTIENKMSFKSSLGGYYTSDVSESYTYGNFVVLENKTAGEKTNQEFRAVIDPNLLVSSLHIPYPSVTGNEMSDIKYLTNKNNVWTSIDFSKLEKVNNNVYKLSANMASLDIDEYFTEVRATIDKFPVSYVSGPAGSIGTSSQIDTYGKLKEGAESATVTYEIYDKSDVTNKETITTTVHAATIGNKITSSDSTLDFYNEDNIKTTQVTAGDRFNVKAKLILSAYPYGTISIVNGAQIYLREVNGMYIDMTSLEIKDELGNEIANWSYTKRESAGELFYTIQLPESTYIGGYLGKDTPTRKSVQISYDVNTTAKLTGSYNAKELVGWGKEGTEPHPTAGVQPVVDIFDFDGDGSKTDKVLSFANNELVVLENKNVLVETFLSLQGEAPKSAYIESDASTASYFTPGTNADYTVKVTNNGDGPADSYSVYVPIPKTDDNFGENFQSEAFKWDMTLTGKLPEKAGFKIEYATNATEDNYETGANYTESPGNLNEVNMIRITTTTPFPAGKEVEFKVGLNVDETFDKATKGDKIGKRNVYNPSYKVVSSTFKGTLTGTKVGAELVIAEIGGLVFMDTDGDGLYNTDKGDIVIEDHEVKLYKQNEDTQAYEPVLDADGKQYTVKTNSSGIYLFDYETGMSYGNYAVQFVEKTGAEYEYTINNNTIGNESINSDAIINDNIPNAGDTYKGWVLNIDPTKPEAKTIGAGFLKYNPPVDLTVSIESNKSSIKVDETATITPTITPDFFDSIKAPITPYTYTVTPSTAGSISVGSDGKAVFTPSAIAAPKTNEDVKISLTIKEIYGNSKTSEEININVISNIAPTLTTSTQEVYVGDSVLDYKTLVSAKDVANVNIDINVIDPALKNTTIEQSIPSADGKYTTAGTYEVVYKVKDARGNEGTTTGLVRVHEKPTVIATDGMYTIGDSEIDTKVDALASATWKEAPETAGTAVTKDAIITKEVSGPSSDFSVIGEYKVTFTATDGNGKTTTKDVKVVITSVDVENVDGVVIEANNFTLTNAEAKSLTSAQAIEKSNAKAYKVTKDDTGTVTAIETLTKDAIIPNLDNIIEIKTVSENGGEFPITFSVMKDGKTATTPTLTVTVEGKQIITDKTVSLKAEGFAISNADAKVISEAEVLTQANAEAKYIETLEVLPSTSLSVVSGLDELHDATANSASYPVVIRVSYGDNKTLDIEIQVTAANSLVKPTLTISDSVVYVGDAEVAYIDNIASVTDADSISVTPTSSNTTIEQSIPTENGKYTAAGTYEVVYKVKDSRGNEGSATGLIRIHEKPTIIAGGATFVVNEGDIDTKVDALASASWKQAPTTVGDAVVEELTPTKTVSGPSSDFSVIGEYEVSFTAIDPNGKETTKAIKVLVISNTGKVEGSLVVDANNFNLSYDDAKALTKNQAIINSGATAYKLVKDEEGNIIDITSLSETFSVDATQLKSIKEAPIQGGEFKLNVTISDNSKSATTEITVFVYPKGITPEEGDELMLGAYPFTIDYTAATALSEADAITSGKVIAYNVHKVGGVITSVENLTSSVSVNADQLDAIRATTKDGGIFKLTYSVTLDGETVSREIEVLVTPKGTPPLPENEDVVLNANKFSFSYNDAQAIDEATIKATGNAKATKITRDSEGTIISFTDISENIEVRESDIDAIKTVTQKGGSVKVQLSVTEDDKTITKDIDVFVLPEGDVIDGIIISANGITIENAQASKFDQATALAKSKATAFKLEYGEDGEIIGGEDITSKLSVDADALKAIQKNGRTMKVHTLVYSVEYEGGSASLEKTVFVLGKGNSTTKKSTLLFAYTPSTSDDLTLGAYPFELDYADAATLDDAQALILAESGAVATIYDAFGDEIDYIDISDDITVDGTELANIVSAGTNGGIYPLTFTIDNGFKNTSITIDVFVKPASSVNVGNTYLSAEGFVINHSDAASLNEADSITKANASAFEVLYDDDGYAEGFVDLLTSLSVEDTELTAIHTADENGGIYPLTIKVTDSSNTEVTKVVNVVVLGTNTPPIVNGLAISAKDITIANVDASSITEAELKTLAEVKAGFIDRDVDEADIIISVSDITTIKAVGKTGGTYPVTFTATYTNPITGQVIVNEVTINVNVLAVNEVVTPSTKPSQNPKTGDTTTVSGYAMMLLLAVGVVIVLKRKEQDI